MKTSTATYTWVSSSMIQFTEIATVIFRRPLSLSLSLSLSLAITGMFAKY